MGQTYLLGSVSVHTKSSDVSSICVDDITNVNKMENMKPDVEPFAKELDREDPTPLTKQVYFGRKQGEAEVDHQARQPKGRIVSNNT